MEGSVTERGWRTAVTRCSSSNLLPVSVTGQPQAAIYSPAALPLQRGNGLGNKSHKEGGRQSQACCLLTQCLPLGDAETKESSLL